MKVYIFYKAFLGQMWSYKELVVWKIHLEMWLLLLILPLLYLHTSIFYNTWSCALPMRNSTYLFCPPPPPPTFCKQKTWLCLSSRRTILSRLIESDSVRTPVKAIILQNCRWIILCSNSSTPELQDHI